MKGRVKRMAMMKKLRGEKGIGERAVRGAIYGILIAFAGAMLLGVLIYNEILGENRMSVCAAIILLVASLAASGTAARGCQSKKIVSCILTAAIMTGLLSSVTILFFDCRFGTVLVPLGGIVSGGMVSGIMSCRKGGGQYPKKKQKRKLYKVHNR